MREPGVKNTSEVIAKALEGDYRQEHLFALKQAVELYDFYHRQIEACDRDGTLSAHDRGEGRSRAKPPS